MQDSEQDRGADAVVAALRDAGVEIVFSLSGNQIMPVYDALFGSGIRLVHTRHEGAAVYMAEAYAQVTGRPGVALITAGPGFANGLSAAWSALCSHTPILVLSGDAPAKRAGHGAFQEMDQTAFAAPAVKASFRPTSAAALEQDVRRALELTTEGRHGPVHLALPDDVLRAPAGAAGVASPVVPAAAATAQAPTGTDLATIRAALDAAERPIILAGPMFRRAARKPHLAAFMAASGLPAIALESPRGLRDPRLGAFVDVLPEADLIITLSKPLDFMVGFAEPPAVAAGCHMIQVSLDADTMARDRNRLTDRDIQDVAACPAATLAALATSAKPHASAPAWRDRVLAAVAHRPAAWAEDATRTERIHPVTVCNAIRLLLDRHPEAVLVIDGGEFGQWSQACLDTSASVINGASGAIGGGIPYAIAAKAARPDEPVFVMMGDGTAGFYLAEFETALRNSLPIIAIIGNDARWNAEHQIQTRDYGANRTHSCELSPTRFDQVIAAMGGHGEYVTSADGLAPALERALAANTAACINVEIEGLAAPVVRLDS
jgi:thiamine pyrophosphate-dependent acetolactate synthase large subunit-like protein